MKKVRIAVVLTGIAIFVVAFSFSHPDFRATAFSTGPPAGHTGGPGDSICTACHIPGGGEGFGPGIFTITPPANYAPGQTHQVVVRHINADPSRMRWGFQMMALAGGNPAGTFVASGGLTQVIDGAGDGQPLHAKNRQPPCCA